VAITVRQQRLLTTGAGALGPVAAVVIAWATSSYGKQRGDALEIANVALVLAVVTVTTALANWVGGVVTSLAAALSLNWFHTEPIRTFRISATTDLLSVLLLAALGVGVSSVTARRVRAATRLGSQLAAGAAHDRVVAAAGASRPAHQLWQLALAATSPELALVNACVVSARAVDLPIIARLPWTDNPSDARFLLPPGGAAMPMGQSSGCFLVIVPRETMTSVLLDRRAVTSFADAVHLALEDPHPNPIHP